MIDPFGTAEIRERVLAGWAAAPVRLREDANAEEDLALGGYRDRVVVELAQNAADAASRAGVPGVLALTLRSQGPDGPVLIAANTGEPLTAAGVQSLATLRASAKRPDDASRAGAGGERPGEGRSDADHLGELPGAARPTAVVGRFGVGFSAVAMVSDEPAVLSRSGGVRFSRTDTLSLVEEAGESAPDLLQEVRRRDGHVPVLRLPFATDGEPPQGYDTAVVLPLREGAFDAVRAQLEAAGDSLLLALPTLSEVVVDVDGEVRSIRDVESRWRVHRRWGRWSDPERAALFADRPTEERTQTGWQVVWAIPRADDALPGAVLAPTPTDEPMSLPALLLATFPLDPARQHVAPGPLADRIVDECAVAYAELLHVRALDGADVTGLVPTGLASGRWDAALRDAVLSRLPDVPLLRGLATAEEAPDAALVRPRDAVTLDLGGDDELVLTTLTPMVAGLVPAPPRARAALRALGVRELGLADLVDQLPMRAEPADWRPLYAGLAPLGVDERGREALGALPVPLADGRIVRGARGLVLADDERLPASALAALAPYGLRVVHPDAAHPLLERLGAQSMPARGVLDHDATRTAVLASPDDEDPDTLADAVLALIQAAVDDGSLAPGELPWLADLALVDAEGELAPAGALTVPGSPAAELLDPEAIGELGAGLVRRWPAAVLAAAGVLVDLAPVVEREIDLDEPPESLDELDGFGTWARELTDHAATATGPQDDRAAGRVVPSAAGPVAEIVAVRDLDCVRPDRWPQALRHLASVPVLRRALVEPVRVRGAGGVSVVVPSYTSWWLRRELALVGTLDPQVADSTARGGHGAGPGHEGAAVSWLAELCDPAPAWVADLDAQVRAALGVLGVRGPGPGVAGEADTALAEVLLERLAEPDRSVSPTACLSAWQVIASAASSLLERGSDLPARDRVRGLVGDGPAPTGSTVVGRDDAVVVDDPRWLQRHDLGALVVASSARAADLADLLDVSLASEVSDGRVTSTGTTSAVPGQLADLLPGCPDRWVEHDDLRVDDVRVEWWVIDGVPHAFTTDGLARALAWAAGRWDLRHAVAALLADPESGPRLAAEDAAG